MSEGVHCSYPVCFCQTLSCVAAFDRSSIRFICRAHVAHFLRLRSWTWNGLCQLSEWPEVALFTAQKPKGWFPNPVIYQNFPFRILDLSARFNACLFSLPGIMATNHQRTGIKKKIVSFMRAWEVALSHVWIVHHSSVWFVCAWSGQSVFI